MRLGEIDKKIVTLPCSEAAYKRYRLSILCVEIFFKGQGIELQVLWEGYRFVLTLWYPVFKKRLLFNFKASEEYYQPVHLATLLRITIQYLRPQFLLLLSSEERLIFALPNSPMASDDDFSEFSPISATSTNLFMLSSVSATSSRMFESLEMQHITETKLEIMSQEDQLIFKAFLECLPVDGARNLHENIHACPAESLIQL